MKEKLPKRVARIGKNLVKDSPLSPMAKRAHWSYLRFVGKRHHIQETKTAEEYNLVNLGTEYGGWTFVDEPDLENSIIISAGLGEDASFDVEFASTYNSKVIVVDPTPRAVHHFESIQDRIGEQKKSPYSETGKERVGAYDLSNIDEQQLYLVEKALWNKNAELEFYEPESESHVSHSLINWKQNYSNNTEYIQVQADTVFSILDSLDINKSEVNLIKLDIEGAEIEVILQMMEENFYPRQILVEFDELHDPSDKAFKRIDQAHGMLLANGYELIYTDGITDFLYFKK
jgi:FkbM family methyltransferase